MFRTPRWSRPSLTSVLLAGLALSACSSGDHSASGPQVEGATLGVEGAHEHGVVRMGFAVDDARLTLDMQLPADAVFGFEHAPSSDEEWEVVNQALAGLRESVGSLVALSDELRCTVESVELIEAPEEHAHDEEHHDEEEHAEHDDEEEHAEGEHDHDGEEHAEDEHDHDEGQHSEVRASIVWSCAQSPEGSPATLRLADVFGDVAQVDLTVITSQGQAGGRVSADAAFSF